MDRQWHAVHPMPKRPTFDQRVAWHRAHAENCGSREGIEEVLERERSVARVEGDAVRGKAD